MRIAVVVPFQDERDHLGTLLAALDRQTRPAELLVLVDDGSRDGSEVIADEYAAGRAGVLVLHRPQRSSSQDRLVDAPEYRAFHEGASLAFAEGEFDVIGKLDGDLDLPPTFLETLDSELSAQPRLGIVGTMLGTLTATGEVVVERLPRYHVRGATKFYRRECLEQIQPVAPILGWDTIDEVKARMLGWATRSVDIEGADVIHLRPVGTRDGLLRAYRRWGVCAYAAGYQPLWVLLGTARRLSRRPYVLGGLNYAWGWGSAHVHRTPRAEPAVRRHLRREQMRRLRVRLARQRM